MAAVIIIVVILSGIAVMALLSGIALYNRLVTLRSMVRSARADVAAVLRKRQALAQHAASEGSAAESSSRMSESMEDVLRIYEDAVRDYNTAVETFPANIMARRFGLEKEGLLKGMPGQPPSS